MCNDEPRDMFEDFKWEQTEKKTKPTKKEFKELMSKWTVISPEGKLRDINGIIYKDQNDLNKKLTKSIIDIIKEKININVCVKIMNDYEKMFMVSYDKIEIIRESINNTINVEMITNDFIQRYNEVNKL